MNFYNFVEKSPDKDDYRPGNWDDDFEDAMLLAMADKLAVVDSKFIIYILNTILN